jgi:hypothetical protein
MKSIELFGQIEYQFHIEMLYKVNKDAFGSECLPGKNHMQCINNYV